MGWFSDILKIFTFQKFVPKLETNAVAPYYPTQSLGIQYNFEEHLLNTDRFIDNETGMMTYRKHANEDVAGRLYFNRPDLVTWQFAHFLGLALEVSNRRVSDSILTTTAHNLDILRRGLKLAHRVTGEKGLLVRSLVKHESGLPEKWMEGKTTSGNYWETNDGTYWYRMPSAKGIYNYMAAACGIIVTLSEKGYNFPDKVVDTAKTIAMNCAEHLMSNDWVVPGFSLQMDDISSQNLPIKIKWNGFNAIVQANIMKAAQSATGDYISYPQDKIDYRLDIAEDFCDVFGVFCKLSGRHIIPMSYNEDHHMFLGFLAAMIMNDNAATTYHKAGKALKHLWQYARYVRHPFAALGMAYYENKPEKYLSPIIEDLENYPAYPKLDYHTNDKKDKKRIYKLSRRPSSSYYWKEPPYEYVMDFNPLPSGMQYNSSDLMIVVSLVKTLFPQYHF